MLAYVIGTALPTCSVKPSLLLPGSKIGVYYCLHREERRIDCLDYLVYQLEKRRAGES